MKSKATARSAVCCSECDRMKAVSRPAVYIGFSYFGTLVLAVFLGESVTPFAAAVLLRQYRTEK